MSTLAMAMAAVLLAGSAPERVSAETQERLDMSGEWRGEARYPNAVGPISLRGWQLTATSLGQSETMRFVVTDEGGGNVRVYWGCNCFGIYKWEGRQLVLCIGEKRPSSFRATDEQTLLILHRVKPRK